MKLCSLARFAFLPYDLTYASQFMRDLLIRRDNLIECIRKLSGEACPSSGKANGEITVAHGLQT
jgi:hypothetical protein